MINAISSEVALYGNEGRNEGLLVILSYYTCALNGVNLKNKKFQKIIIYAILGYGFINFIYGLMQIGFIKQSLIPIVEDWYYARGFEGNSMFFASLISMCYGIVDYRVQTADPESLSYDINIFGVNKGSAVNVLIDKLGIKKEDTYCFCDGSNDLELVKACINSYVMKNGVDELKRIAFGIADDVIEDGAADIGVVGKDTIMEENRKNYEVLDLGFGKCKRLSRMGYRWKIY